jgi:hypothetical protein
LLNTFDRWGLKIRGKKRAKKEAKRALAEARAKQAKEALCRSADPAVTAIKNKVAAPMLPEIKKEVLIKSTFEDTGDHNPIDEEDMAGLYRIDQNDKEIEDMLDEIDASLDGIASFFLAMNEESLSQPKNLESIGKIVDASIDGIASFFLAVKEESLSQPKNLESIGKMVDASIDGIASLFLAMKEESLSQPKNLESIGKIVEACKTKQAVAITQISRNLTARLAIQFYLTTRLALAYHDIDRPSIIICGLE